MVGEVGEQYQGLLCVPVLFTSPGEQQAPVIGVAFVFNPGTIVIQIPPMHESTIPSGADQEGLCEPSTPRRLPAPPPRLGATLVPTTPRGGGGSTPFPASQLLPVSPLAGTGDGTPTAVALTAPMVPTRPYPVEVGLTAKTGI
jgi:hypothetical protein